MLTFSASPGRLVIWTPSCILFKLITGFSRGAIKTFRRLFVLVRIFEIGVGFTADFLVQWSEHASPPGEPLCEGEIFDSDSCQ